VGPGIICAFDKGNNVSSNGGPNTAVTLSYIILLKPGKACSDTCELSGNQG
jgi:hypothetical protein